jgi:FtsH-binding integral membrane protein
MTNRREVAIAAVLDVAVIVAFVAIGRRSHHEDGAVFTGVLRVAAPFLIGLAIAWIGARAWKAPSSTTTGMVIWPVTVVVGMLLRRFLFDDGTALPFIIVASAFTGVSLVGWRALRRQ